MSDKGDRRRAQRIRTAENSSARHAAKRDLLRSAWALEGDDGESEDRQQTASVPARASAMAPPGIK